MIVRCDMENIRGSNVLVGPDWTNRTAAIRRVESGRRRQVDAMPVALMPLSMRSTTNSPPSSRETVAKVLADLAAKVGEQNLKDDFSGY